MTATPPRRVDTAGAISPTAVFTVALITLVGGLATLTASVAVADDERILEIAGPDQPTAGGPVTWQEPTSDPAPEPAETGTELPRGVTQPTEVGAQHDQVTPPPQPEAEPSPTTLATAGEVEPDAPRPTGVRIPGLGVRATSIDLGLHDDGRLEVPSDAAQAGWWTGGPRPGERGPAVVVGHVDSRQGPGVFVHLHRVTQGMQVLIDREDGTTAHFEVQGILRVPKDEFPTDLVYGETDDARLRLITCGGTFDRQERSYRDNVIVDLALIGWS